MSKTLRFELVPDERTKVFLENSDLIAEDEHRAESYKLVKKIIDRYHKAFIENILSSLTLQCESDNRQNSLEEFCELYHIAQKTDADKKSIERVQEQLRKQIVGALTKDARFKRIDKKELIREDLMQIITPDEKALIDEFRDFTTYFTGFHENRKNMYSHEAKSTAIAYRIIHENLPKFIDNIETFNKIASSPVAENLSLLYNDMKECLNVNRIDEMFSLDYFSEVMTQSQIEVYNAIIGGKTLNDGTKIQGINEYVNLYNQKQARENRLPKLKPLFKQILSDREAVSWLPEEFNTDAELLKTVNDFYSNLHDSVFSDLRELLENISNYNLAGIFIPNDKTLTDISQSLYGDWGLINRAITEDVKSSVPQKRNETFENYDDRISKIIKRQDYFSIDYLNRLLAGKDTNICSHFETLGAVNTETKQTENLFAQIFNAFTEAKDLLSTPYPCEKNLAQDKVNVAKLKTLLDAIKDLQHYVKPLVSAAEAPDKDERFYGDIAVIWEELDVITPLYNKVRNRMTRKPYSLEKFKLTFNIKGNFLGGWVDSKTDKSDNGTQYGGYLFRKKNLIGEYDYFIGMSSNKKLFRPNPNASGQYERLDYYQPKSQTIYGNSYAGKEGYEHDKQELITAIVSFLENKHHEELLQQIRTVQTPSAMMNIIQSNSDIFNQLLKDKFFAAINKKVTDNLHKTIIGLNRVSSASDYKNEKFAIFTEPQQIIDEICNEKIFNYFVVDDNEIDNAMNDYSKPFLFFKISNKDLSYSESSAKGHRKSRGIDNLHTLYFKSLMSGNQSVIDIGTAEVFFRRSSIKSKGVTHPANVDIPNKNKIGNKSVSKFPYDIIKNKRYTVDKFGFHLSIIYNYKEPKDININGIVREYIKTVEDLHFIGIDRGERHLLYVTVIDSKGRIKEQFSLNEIINEYNGNSYRTNYRQLLEKRDEERQRERQSWNTIEGIKELKQGYLSQVIHKIVTLMVKYKAIVVLEDLNMGFKRGRQKVESSVYQQFEKALIDKLNLLVDKKLDADSTGGLLHAYQLTNKFTSFREMGHQNGFLFYIPAWNTSKIDPVTGFVDLLHPRYESVDKARAFFCKFKTITYNKAKDWFEFDLDYNDFTTKAEGTRTCWTLCTHGARVETFRNPNANSNWDNREVDLTAELKALFDKYGINPEANLKEEIARQTERNFFERLIHLLKLTLQMRNSITGTEVDYLVSPVADENGAFYDSRTCADGLPLNADANGAYNIARKGLWAARQIHEAPIGEKVKLAISNKEWLQFAQSKPYLDD